MGAFRAQGGSAVNYRRTHGSYEIELIQKNGGNCRGLRQSNNWIN
jgi:hypothetical protein